MNDARRVGTVSWFDDARGYGFIKPDGGGRDLIVTIAALLRSRPAVETLAPGQRVAFRVAPGRRGPGAINIRLLDEQR